MGNLDHNIIRRMHTLDVSRKRPRVTGERTFNTDETLVAIGEELYNIFGRELLRLDLTRHKLQQQVINDSTQSKERRYYVSTQSRRMFKRLMVATKMDAKTLTTTEIAAELLISHKAASQLVDDALAFGVIETVQVMPGEDVCEQTGAVFHSKRDQKTYAATQEWANSFLNNGCLHAYQTGEEITRARTLYAEYHRYVELNKIKSKTEFPEMLNYGDAE